MPSFLLEVYYFVNNNTNSIHYLNFLRQVKLTVNNFKSNNNIYMFIP